MSLLPTFADWLYAFGLPAAPGHSEDYRLTVAWLQYDQAVAERVEHIKNHSFAGENIRGLFDVLSEDIIDRHLGEGWFIRHVDNSATSNQARNYFNADGPAAAQLLAAHRTHELARRLYQLQSFPWFADVVKRIRTRDLSGAGFEIDVVLLLHNLIARVTPRDETGQRGEDYDIHLNVHGLEVPVEVKAKADDTPYTAKTVIRTVKGAARQLPSGSTGIVVLRIPTAWVGRELEDTYADALGEATRQTSRVGAVITAIDKPHLNRGQSAGHIGRVYDFFMADGCSEELWNACLYLKEIVDSDLSFFAPSPPF